MISRFGRLSFAVLAAALSLPVAACQRVPLLAPSGSSITLTATASALPLNGTTDIIAQVIEPAGTPPHQGTHVSFTTTLGTLQPAEAETDINGRVAVKFAAGTSSGTATITAASGGANVGANGAIKIAIGAAAVGRVVVAANPATVSANGGTSTIIASVSDVNGNALGGIPVTFTTTAGSVSSAVVTTDPSGNASTTLTTNRQATVTATAGVQGTTTGGTTGGGTGTTTGGTTSTQASASVTVNVNATASITVTATPTTPTAGQTVTFTIAQGTGGSPIQRTVVNFGDGTTQTFTGLPTVVTHIYTSPGTYVTQVSATDTFGDTSVGSAAVTVGPRPQITATISVSTTNPTPNTPTTFAITATPTTGNAITSITVDFGDGTRTTLQGNATSAQHIYASGGTYTVTATATDSSGATGSASTVVVIGGGTTANFTFSPSSPKVGETVTFNGSDSTGQGSLTYQWDFGDGTVVTNTGPAQTHQFQAAGSYTVRLTVTDQAGRTATKTQTVTVTS